MAWYDAGTVKVTANSTTVMGTGTKWLAGARQGEAFVAPDGRLYEVLNIASDTSLTLTKLYRGATATGQPYALAPMQGYVKELADRAAELLPALSDIGTAAKGTLTTSTIDPITGRVMRNADWGFGGANGVAADQNILNNTVNGIYRSGSSDEGKPDGHTAGSYFKMGWGPTYYGLLYNSPITDKWHVRTVNNGAANSWKELVTVGAYGLGSTGAGDVASGDAFPGGSLDTASVGSGLYYVPPAEAQASGLPDRVLKQGVVMHRQSGSGGGQIFVSFNGDMVVRGRRSNGYNGWREVLTAGLYGFGGAQAVPESWDAQRTGWYYKSGAKPAWGGGAFFLDLAYNTTYVNSGLRISTDPYTDNFYMNGAVSGQKTYRDACKLVHDKNIVGDVTAGSVIATGSNANGTWVRFADGTQICHGHFGFSGSSWKPASPVIHYPLSFISKPAVTIQSMNDGSGYYTAAQVAMDTSAGSFYIRSSTGVADSGTSLDGDYIAIGRWKA